MCWAVTLRIRLRVELTSSGLTRWIRLLHPISSVIFFFFFFFFFFNFYFPTSFVFFLLYLSVETYLRCVYRCRRSLSCRGPSVLGFVSRVWTSPEYFVEPLSLDPFLCNFLSCKSSGRDWLERGCSYGYPWGVRAFLESRWNSRTPATTFLSFIFKWNVTLYTHKRNFHLETLKFMY